MLIKSTVFNFLQISQQIQKESPDTPGGLEDLGDRAGLEALGSPECLGSSEGPGAMSKPRDFLNL